MVQAPSARTESGCRRLKLAMVYFGSALILLGAVILSNDCLVGSNPKAMIPAVTNPLTLEQTGSYLAAVLQSADQSVSMLMTVQLSLFVVAGFAVRRQLAGDRDPSAIQIGIGFVFVVTAFMSVTLGYAARMQALKLIQLGTGDFQSVTTTVGRQAIFVAISAIAAVCMIFSALVDPQARKKPRNKDAGLAASSVLDRPVQEQQMD